MKEGTRRAPWCGRMGREMHLVSAAIALILVGCEKAKAPGPSPAPDAQRSDAPRDLRGVIDSALNWLARCQEADGRWDARKHGGGDCDEGVTGLAVLAFLSAGHNEKVGKHRDAVDKAIRWLIGRQDAKGLIGAGTVKPNLNHAIAGLALSETYAMYRLEDARRAAQRAADCSVDVLQTKYSGWGDGPGETPNFASTCWFVLHLKSALDAGLTMKPAGFIGATGFLGECTADKPGRNGLVSYRPGQEPTHSLTASGMLCYVLLGWRRDDRKVKAAADSLLEKLPSWKPGEIDYDYWFFGSQAVFNMGGAHHRTWYPALRELLLAHQRTNGDLSGSWDPGSDAHMAGGRVYSTAMATMCLAVPYRHLPLHKLLGVADTSSDRSDESYLLPPAVGDKEMDELLELVEDVVGPEEIEELRGRGRVRIHWVNAQGQEIWRPKQAYADDHQGPRPRRSLAGARIEITLDRVAIQDFNDLARTLLDLNFKNPVPVVIDVQDTVPFKWAAAAVDACARAEVKDARFHSLELPGFDPRDILVAEGQEARRRNSRSEQTDLLPPFAIKGKDPETPPPHCAVVNILRSGEIVHMRKKLSLESLGVQLSARVKAAPRDGEGASTLAVRIRADADCLYGSVKAVLAKCASLRVGRILFSVSPAPRKK